MTNINQSMNYLSMAAASQQSWQLLLKTVAATKMVNQGEGGNRNGNKQLAVYHGVVGSRHWQQLGTTAVAMKWQQ